MVSDGHRHSHASVTMLMLAHSIYMRMAILVVSASSLHVRPMLELVVVCEDWESPGSCSICVEGWVRIILAMRSRCMIIGSLNMIRAPVCSIIVQNPLQLIGRRVGGVSLVDLSPKNAMIQASVFTRKFTNDVCLLGATFTAVERKIARIMVTGHTPGIKVRICDSEATLGADRLLKSPRRVIPSRFPRRSWFDIGDEFRWIVWIDLGRRGVD